MCNTYTVIVLFKSHSAQFSSLASSLNLLSLVMVALAVTAAVVAS